MRQALKRARAWRRRLIRRLDAALVPGPATTAEASNRDYRRVVVAIAAPAIVFFLPSLPVAGVPPGLWLPVTILTLAVSSVVAMTFLVVPRGTVAAYLAPLCNGAVLTVISLVLRPYYHALDLLFPLVVAGHAVVHGIGPGLVAVAFSTIAVTFVVSDPAGANVSDVYYTGLYLLGSALLPWVAWRVAQRRARLLADLERRTERQRAWLERILRSIGDAVVVVDASGARIATNAAYDGLCEAAGGNLVPLDDHGRRLPGPRWPEARAARGETFEMPFTLATADGERRWFEARGGPTRDTTADRRGRTVGGGVVVIRDITDRSLRSQTEAFMATASHELRTPIAALHGYVQLLERRLDPTAMPRESEFARIALSQTRRLGQLLEWLLDLARLQTGRLDVESRPVELGAVIAQALEAARPIAPDRDYRLDLGTDAVTVEADPERLEQVVLNLLTNAIHHAPNSRQIDVRVAVEDGRAIVAVHDHGPGIPATRLARLFSRPAGRGSAGDGLGIGLFISRELVRAQRGSIDVESQLGEGTTVTVRMPLASEPRRRPRRRRIEVDA